MSKPSGLNLVVITDPEAGDSYLLVDSLFGFLDHLSDDADQVITSAERNTIKKVRNLIQAALSTGLQDFPVSLEWPD